MENAQRWSDRSVQVVSGSTGSEYPPRSGEVPTSHQRYSHTARSIGKSGQTDRRDTIDDTAYRLAVALAVGVHSVACAEGGHVVEQSSMTASNTISLSKKSTNSSHSSVQVVQCGTKISGRSL